MSSSLVLCHGCGRHVFVDTPRCPFCSVTLSSRARVAALTAAAGLALVACRNDAKQADALDASSAASTSAASTSPPATGPDRPRDDAGAPGDATVVGSVSGDLGGLGSLGHGSRDQGTVYGPAPLNAGPRNAEVSLGPASVTGQIPNVERVLAALRPRMRACYKQGLLQDPSMTGAATFRAKVTAAGAVSSVDTTMNSGLSPAVVACMSRTLSAAKLDAPGAPAELSFSVSCVPSVP